MKENRKAFIILEIVLAAAVLILTAAMRNTRLSKTAQGIGDPSGT